MPERGWYGGQKRTHQPTHPRRAAPIQQYSSSCVSTNRVAVSYTHRRTNLPTHDVLQQYSSTAADALAQTEMVCLTLGFPLFDYSPPFRGASDPSPGGPFNTPRSPSRSWAPFHSPGSPRAAVWDGHGADPRPGEAKWSSGVAAVFWACYNKNVFKDPFGHLHYHRGALHSKDDRSVTSAVDVRSSNLISGLLVIKIHPQIFV